MTASSGDPFGLFVFHRNMPDTEKSLVVYPMTVDLPVFAPSIGSLRGGETRYQRTHHVTTNVSGTREYAPGDSFNRIHWRSTARYDRLIVKEFELDPTADVWILLDMERGIHMGAWWEQAWYEREMEESVAADRVTKLAPNTEEYAVTCAASIANIFWTSNARSVCRRQPRTRLCPTRPWGTSVDAFAGNARRGGIERNESFAQLIARETAILNRSITIVLITASPEFEWIQYAQDLRRRGFHLIVVLIVDASALRHGD